MLAYGLATQATVATPGEEQVIRESVCFVVQTISHFGGGNWEDSGVNPMLGGGQIGFWDVNDAKEAASRLSRTWPCTEKWGVGDGYPARTVKRVVTDTVV